MNTIRSILLTTAIVVMILPLTATSQESETYSFYRNSEGEVSSHTKEQEKGMQKLAKENGHITLWLVLKYPYNVDIENMTPEEITSQETEVAAGFSEILTPLVAAGDAWHPPSGVVIKGPGCTVRATPKGLKQLLSDTRLYQITSYD